MGLRGSAQDRGGPAQHDLAPIGRRRVIQGSDEIISGSELGNPEVIKALTADGSNIADWGKFATQTFQSPSGPFQVHFYYNATTGAANYTLDFKAVFNG